jgi:hypothetical protein
MPVCIDGHISTLLSVSQRCALPYFAFDTISKNLLNSRLDTFSGKAYD